MLAGGKYRVDAVLGVGGMGVVVAATHLALKQIVAIKFMLPKALEDRDAVERFLLEGRSAAQLKSEHVARVLDTGTLESGAPYIVMEFLEGITLDQYLEQGNVPSVGEAVEYVVQACEAVAEAHTRGIIHRDLKLTNLFLTKTADQRPRVKIIDFGLSKSLSTDAKRITKDFSLMGTPAYMSPEQLRGDEVDTRSDLWSLGVCLYELLTVTPPFQAESVAEVCAAVLQATPPAIRELRPEVPEALAHVVMRCLSKEPGGRYPTVAELAEALDPFVPDGTTRAGDRIRRVQSADVSGPILVPVPIEPAGRGTASSWGADGLMVAPRSTHRGWYAATAVIAVLAVVVLVLGLRARGASAPAQAAQAAPGPAEPPPAAVTAPPEVKPNEPASASASAPAPALASAPRPVQKPAGAKRSPSPPPTPAAPRGSAPNRDKLLESR